MLIVLCGTMQSHIPAGKGTKDCNAKAARLTSTTCTMASSSGAVKSPNRAMPFRSPSACDNAVPSASAMSSLVWWSSIQVSPSASTLTSKRPCEASCCASEGQGQPGLQHNLHAHLAKRSFARGFAFRSCTSSAPSMITKGATRWRAHIHHVVQKRDPGVGGANASAV